MKVVRVILVLFLSVGTLFACSNDESSSKQEGPQLDRASKNELSGKDWVQLSKDEKFEVVSKQMKKAKLNSVQRSQWIKIVVNQVNRTFQDEENQNGAVRDVIQHWIKNIKN